MGLKKLGESTLREPAVTLSKVQSVPDSRQVPSLLFHTPLEGKAAISFPLVKSSPTYSNLKKKKKKEG